MVRNVDVKEELPKNMMNGYRGWIDAVAEQGGKPLVVDHFLDAALVDGPVQNER